MGKDQPLWVYVKQAIQDIEIINILGLNRIDGHSTVPFIKVVNFEWDPHPSAEEVQYKRRETGEKLSTKFISDTRIGILRFDMYIGARDKNGNLETHVIPNKIYVPLEDDQGRYLMDKIWYTKYQLVDKLLYPSGKGNKSITLKSLLPIIIDHIPITEVSIDGYLVDSEIGMVKIFKTMEPIMSCFMHVPAPLSYLDVFPTLQFCDRIMDDKDKFEYFQPNPDVELYIKGYKKGLEKFAYVRSILVMAIALLRKHKPQTFKELQDPVWWIFKQSDNDAVVQHRGACHEMHVARMLDTISAQVLPIPLIDKRNMISLLRYVLQTEFNDLDIYSFENKRLRLGEIISTIATAEVSAKLKRIFKYGNLIKMKDLLMIIGFRPQMILKAMNKLGTASTIDFANDMDYYQKLRFTKSGPNSLGRTDTHRITFNQRQLHPSMMGIIDLLDISKDVGQSGTISPWADISKISDIDVNKYPNVKYDLYKFNEEEFPLPGVRFNAKNIVEYNAILDRLEASSYINMDYGIASSRNEE
jgi:hypothetical protein